MTKRIAVVGSGISGLATAWLLSRDFDVQLFEHNSYIGGHTNTVDVDTPSGPLPVDTGFIVYNQKNYPLLSALFDHLGVETQATDMSFAVSMGDGSYEYGGSNLNTLFAQRRQILNPRHWKLLSEILRFGKTAKAELDGDLNDETTLGEFLSQHGFGDALMNQYLLPMASAIWSCPINTMSGFPARSLLQFYENHGLLNVNDRPQWRTVIGGSQVYVRRLLRDLAGKYHVNRGISSVTRQEHNVLITDVHGEEHEFDEVILASHADQTLNILANPSTQEAHLLSAFSYQPNRAILHTDTHLMPKRKTVWSSWNYMGGKGKDDHDSLSVTYWMNLLQRLPASTPYLVTLNPYTEPRAEHVIKEIQYSHPVFTTAAMRAQTQLHEIQGKDRLWYCGAWTGYGFHEDGLRSAVTIAEKMGVSLPWDAQKNPASDDFIRKNAA